MNSAVHELIPLADSGRTIAEAEDIRHRAVKDVDGEDIGKVEDLLVDVSENRVSFLVVASGGFLGLGEQRSYIPVDAVVSVAEDEVRISRSREHVAGAPAYDPELINDREYNETVFGYYEIAPFWAHGYTYPAYPGPH